MLKFSFIFTGQSPRGHVERPLGSVLHYDVWDRRPHLQCGNIWAVYQWSLKEIRKFISKFLWKLQLNLHETDLLFRYLSHHLTWHCLLISGFFPVLVCCDHKIVLHWHENQYKNNLLITLRKSWEISRNQLTISCQIVANISKL